MLTIGWDEQQASNLHRATIRDIYQKQIKELSACDFAGESPDCLTRETTILSLGAIYRKVLSDSEPIWVIKFIGTHGVRPPKKGNQNRWLGSCFDLKSARHAGHSLYPA
jgi:hypothetical protein